jgi:antitoxin MazE
MYTTIQKWGNSQAVRLPKAALEKAGLQENDRVEIRVHDRRNLLIVPSKRHLTLRERAAGYHGDYRPVEWDTGKPAGKEVW